MTASFWAGKRVFITGHTGFKGKWLALLLRLEGAQVTGFALDPADDASIFSPPGAPPLVDLRGDIRDVGALTAAVAEHKPDVVFHLAAQSLVRESYEFPVETYATNVMGTVHLLEAVRQTAGVRVTVVVTSDKCYENREWVWAYRETDRMGGHDPYSNSKGCAELVCSAYRRSYFAADSAPRLATARAGNVIGGGDWAKDRLVPDIVRAFSRGETVLIRNPGATRPWQHVLVPLSGYIRLAERLWDEASLSGEWNFGPLEGDDRPVQQVVEELRALWGEGAAWRLDVREKPHEAHMLRLDSSKAKTHLGWASRVPLSVALDWTVEWYRAFSNDRASTADVTLRQVRRFRELQA